MSLITRTTAVSFALGLALIALFAWTTTRAGAAETTDLRVAVACSPLTSAQGYRDPVDGKYKVVTNGTPQRCRIKLTNYSRDVRDRNGNVVVPAAAITDITYVRPTNNEILSREAYRFPGTTCDLNGCTPFTLQPGQSVTIIEDLTFVMTQDGRGKTTATATGVQRGLTITGSAQEQSSLP